MKHINFLLSSEPRETLDSFARKIFSIAKINDYEERSSTNYVDERYFVGRDRKIELKVMFSDDSDNLDLPFWVRLSILNKETEFDESEIHDFVYGNLLPAGFRVARMDNFGQVSEQRIDYNP